MWRHFHLLRSLLVSLVVCCMAGNALAQGETLPTPDQNVPETPQDMLYDQKNNPGTNSNVITSQNFESALDSFDGQAADDFAVTNGQFWTITSVEISGTYQGSAVVSSVNVQFYSGSELPGSLEYTGTFVPSAGLNSGSFVINLNPAARLGPGHHWLSVQANLNFNGSNVWQWKERAIQSGNAAAYRNPGGGFSSTCTDWGRLWDVCINDGTHAPDLLFRLNGTTGPAFSLYLPTTRR